MQSFRPHVRFAIVILLSIGAMTGVRGGQGRMDPAGTAGIRTLSDVQIQAAGFHAISGIAVDTSGAVLVTDRAEGTLSRVDVLGNRHTLLTHLHKAEGVAVDQVGDVLVLDEGGNRLVRFSASGSFSVVTSALKRARAIAVGPDGRVWISMRREESSKDNGGLEKADASHDVVARLESSGALTTLATGFVGVHALAADASCVYVAMDRLETDRGRQRTTLACVTTRLDGSVGPVEPLLRDSLQRTLGVAVDAVGDVFVSGISKDTDRGRAGVILKRRRSGEVSELAAGLDDPVALAFAPAGDLVAADGRLGHILWFKATEAPVVTVPAFTNHTPLSIRGTSIPGALVRAFGTSGLTGPLATAATDVAGRFMLQVPLAFNTETRVSFLATSAAGAGLVSVSTAVHVVHDDRIPTVAVEEPPAGIHVRERIALRGRGRDEGSGIATLTFMVDDALLETVSNPESSGAQVANVGLDTRNMAEGPHTLTVSATDRAGNTAGAAQLLVVDRTSPETQIVAGPAGETAQKTAIFAFKGIDVQSANLEFAWRLDGASWSGFVASSEIEFAALDPGVHRFEVKARDLAGNEDQTPASHTFTVRALQIRILEPTPGAGIATETIWVRGIVEGGGDDVTVTIPLPPEIRSELSLESLSASTEAGTFAAEVPVTPGTNTVTAIARDGLGASSTDVVGVDVIAPLPTADRLEALPAAGFAPHTTRFVATMLPPGASYALDLESDGTIDYEGDTLADREFVYTQPGVHVARLQVTTVDGGLFTARTVVQVYARTSLQTRVDAIWGGFKEALRTGDILRTVSFVHSARRAAWETYFRQFTLDLFAATGTMFSDVTVLEVAPGRAECEMIREVEGLLYSFPVTFQIDTDGGWRLWQF